MFDDLFHWIAIILHVDLKKKLTVANNTALNICVCVSVCVYTQILFA